MRKTVIVLSFCALALVGCGEKTLHEAEVRANGPVAEDHNAFWEGPCSFDTKHLVVDQEESVWLDRHAPICDEDLGNSRIDMHFPFLTKMATVPADEVGQIKEVDSVDPEQYMEMYKVKVVNE